MAFVAVSNIVLRGPATRNGDLGFKPVAAAHVTFSSGWDEAAYKRWFDTKSMLAMAIIFSSENVLDYATYPLSTVRSHAHESIPGGL